MNTVHKEIMDHYHTEANTTIYHSISKKNEKIRESLTKIRRTRIYNKIYHIIIDLHNTAMDSIHNEFANVSDE